MATTSDAMLSETRSIKAIDALTAHRITSGQVVIDLQTAVKELVENSLDAGATNIEVRFKDHGLDSIEVIDNGTGIASSDYDVVALKHHTSKLSSFEDLNSVTTFGFRGEALASLCALSGSVAITTATASTAPVGTVLELDRLGRVTNRSGKVARQKGTTVTVSGIFKPLPVRRKEFERNAKREFGKALNLLNAYALVPCTHENGGVRLVVSNQLNGRKSIQLRTDGSSSLTSSISALWGPKTLENLMELELTFDVETEKSALRRMNAGSTEATTTQVVVRGMVSKFSLNCGRSASDRQFFFINGRPCNPTKVQKAFNETYRTFNATQVPFIVANFTLPNGSHDINVSPDKRTIFIHSEDNLVQALKTALEERFAPERSTYSVKPTQTQATPRAKASAPRGPPGEPCATECSTPTASAVPTGSQPLFLDDSDDEVEVVHSSSLSNVDIDMGEPQLLIESNASESSAFQTTVRMLEPKATLPPNSLPRGTCDEAPMAVDQFDNTSQVDVAELTGDEGPTSPTAMQICDDGTGSPAQEDGRTSSTRHPSPAKDSDWPSIPSLTPTAVAPQPSPAISCTPFNKASRAPKKDSTQLVLDTSGAAWNLRRAANADGLAPDVPRKRPKLSHHGSPPESITAAQHSKLGFRSKMASYALPGSQVARGGQGSDSSENEQDADDGCAEVEEGTVSISQETSRRGTRGANSLEPGPADATPGTPLDTAEQPPSGSSAAPSPPIRRPAEVVKSFGVDTVKLRFDLRATSSAWQRLRNTSERDNATRGMPLSARSLARTAGVDSAEAADAEEALSRVITKVDFSSMEVVGQFNLGFIIVRRRSSGSDHAVPNTQACPMDDLFIVDQHAADEKYNFETLQQTTKIDSQALISPRPLELTASDELLALENIEILRQNGFEIDTGGNPEDQFECRQRLRLVAQPVSKTTVFDMKDLEELLHLLRDQPQGQMVRCSKARAMFASRACRKSVMVGMPLKLQQMVAIVRHMGTMDQPWNCPHGRPTMRHLSDISRLGRNHLSDKRPDWQAFTLD